MDRVSTASGYNSVLVSLLQAEANQNTAQQQVTTGKVADDLEGYASSADALTASKSLSSRITTQIANAATLSDQLSAQNQALTSVASAAQGATSAITEAIATGDATTLMASLQSQFSTAVDALNTQYNGRYLFSGGEVDTQPVAASTLSDLSGGVAAVFKNGPTAQVSRLDDNTTTTTGMLASTVGTPLFTALQSIEAYSNGPNGPLNGPLTTTQTAFLEGVVSTFDSAETAANDAVSANGVVQDQVTAAQAELQARSTTLTNAIGDITNADAAVAASNLTLAQTAVQTSAQVFSTLTSTNLISLLGGGS
jgi:flagellar hook-associated protein 3 FlgL